MEFTHGTLQYEYFPIRPADIRALKIQQPRWDHWNEPLVCRLDKVSVESFDGFSHAPTTDYIAISYTWGDTSDTRLINIMDSRYSSDEPAILSVGFNCWLALWQARYHGLKGYIWIDAISINQADLDEKAMQIPLMSSTFGGASSIIVCLGADGALGQINLSWAAMQTKAASRTAARNACVTAVQTLVQERYFTRLWIVQELLLASHVVFLQGYERLDCTDFELILNSLAPETDLAAFDRIRALLKGRHEVQKSHSTPDCLEILNRYGDSECFDLRDKVYGLVGLLSRRPGHREFPVDYHHDAFGVLLDLADFLSRRYVLEREPPHAIPRYWETLDKAKGLLSVSITDQSAVAFVNGGRHERTQEHTMHRVVKGNVTALHPIIGANGSTDVCARCYHACKGNCKVCRSDVSSVLQNPTRIEHGDVLLTVPISEETVLHLVARPSKFKAFKILTRAVKSSTYTYVPPSHPDPDDFMAIVWLHPYDVLALILLQDLPVEQQRDLIPIVAHEKSHAQTLMSIREKIERPSFLDTRSSRAEVQHFRRGLERSKLRVR